MHLQVLVLFETSYDLIINIASQTKNNNAFTFYMFLLAKHVSINTIISQNLVFDLCSVN